MESIRELLTRLARTVDAPDPERAEHLWAAYRAGGPDAEAAFGTLMGWYGPLIYRRVRGFVRSDAADDVFQEVVTHLHRHRRRLTEFAHALRWARAVAVSLSLRALRTDRRRRVREHAHAVTTTAVLPDQPDDLLDAVRVAVTRLPPREREAVALVFFEGLSRQAAAAAVGVHRDTLAKRIDAALGRLRAMLPAGVVAAAGATAVEGVLATTPVRADRLAALVAAAWERAGAAGSSWPAVAWWTGGLTVALGLVVGGVVWWPQPERPAAVADPLPPRESLQAQNLRILKAEVIPKVLAELQKSMPPDNPVSVADVRAFGSEVEVEFRPARPVPWLFESRLQMRYCVLTRTGWAQAFNDRDGRWQNVNLNPGPVRIPLPLGRSLDLPRAEDRPAMARLFDTLPPDDRAEQEQVKYWFGPGGWTGDEFTVSAVNRGVAGNADALFVTTMHGQTFVRRATGGWRYWGGCEGWNLAADETHLYYTGGSTVRASRIDSPSAEPVAVGATPLDLPLRAMTLAAGQLFVVTEDGSRLCARPLSLPSAGWSKLVRPDPAPRLASDGRRLFAHDNQRLQVRKLDPPDSPWDVLGPTPSGIKHLVVWGDRVLGIPKYPGPIYARPTTAGPDVGWDEVGRVVGTPD